MDTNKEIIEYVFRGYGENSLHIPILEAKLITLDALRIKDGLKKIKG